MLARGAASFVPGSHRQFGRSDQSVLLARQLLPAHAWGNRSVLAQLDRHWSLVRHRHANTHWWVPRSSPLCRVDAAAAAPQVQLSDARPLRRGRAARGRGLRLAAARGRPAGQVRRAVLPARAPGEGGAAMITPPPPALIGTRAIHAPRVSLRIGRQRQPGASCKHCRRLPAAAAAPGARPRVGLQAEPHGGARHRLRLPRRPPAGRARLPVGRPKRPPAARP